MTDQNTESVTPEPEEAAPAFDETELEAVIDEIRGEQNLGFGIVAGVVAAALGATIWASVIAWTHYQIGWLAIGVGFLVGIAIKLAGRGIDNVFGIAGAGLALVGCAAGNYVGVCAVYAEEEARTLLEILGQTNLEQIQSVLVGSFTPFDVLFYGIAGWEGYRLAFRRVTQEEVAARIAARRPGA